LPHRKSTDDGADLVGHEAGLQYAGDESVGRVGNAMTNSTANASRAVGDSIRSLTTQSIAVTMMQWTGPQLHVQTVDWTLVKAGCVHGSGKEL
jgi:hypothetical protein